MDGCDSDIQGDRLMTNTLRVGWTTSISRVDSGMSSAVRTQLNTISPGLADRLTVANHFNPAAATPWTTNPNDLGVGWLLYDPHSTPPTISDDADPIAPFAKRADFFVPDGAEVRIDTITRGNPTQIHTLDDTAVLSANWNYTNCPGGGPFYQIKNWTGDNTASLLFADSVTGTIVSSSRIDLNVDSTGWSADPASGAAKVRFSGGSGNHSLSALPDGTGQTLLGDIHYRRYISKAPVGFKINDAVGGDKGMETYFNPQSFMGAPGWGGFSGDGFVNGDDDFAYVALGGSLYLTTEFDGTTYDITIPGQGSIVGQWFASKLIRGEYAVFEIIYKMPRSRGISGEMWWYVNGVPSNVLGTTPASNGQSHHTFRIGDQSYPPVVEAAWRQLSENQATTVGGGGSMSIPGRRTQIAEMMHSVGISDAGAAASGFHITCDEGDTPPAGTIHFTAELRDADGVRMDVYTDLWNPGSGRQKLHITSSSGTASLVAKTSDAYFAGDGLGRVRIQVTGAASGVPITLTLSLDEVANNDKLTGNHFDGSITVNPT